MEHTEAEDLFSSPWYIGITLTICVPLVFCTIIGNILVLLSWITQKSIRSPQNVYFVSLALADLLLGAFVLPLTVSYVYNTKWIYGPNWCKIWIATDFALCPISAFHLVVIGADRYRTVTEGVSYIQRRSLKRAFEVVGIIWLLGVWIVLPVMALDWEYIAKDPGTIKECHIKTLPFWVLNVTFTSMLLPLYLLIRIYSQIFKEIKNRLKIHDRSPIPSHSHVTRDEDSKEIQEIHSSNDAEAEESASVSVTLQIPVAMTNGVPKNSSKTKKNKILIEKERRAAKTMGIIIGAFFLCWTPWYTMEMYDMMVPTNWKPHPFVSPLLAILGFSNSCVNPIIYAWRNAEFKVAFIRILKCQWG